MPLDIVIGAQWGDEGKGRVVDLMSENSDIVTRYNGGDNAGHTVTVGEKIYKLHVIPSGIIHPNTIGVLGNGMVLNPQTLVEEIKMLQEVSIFVTSERLWISDAIQLITPAHRLLDQTSEKSRSAQPDAGLGQLMWIKPHAVVCALVKSWTRNPSPAAYLLIFLKLITC